MTNNIHIRPAQDADLGAIYALMAEADMYGTFEVHTCLLAENDADELLGFIRLEEAEGRTYIRPIVVSHKHHGLGIGRTLLESIAGKYPKLTAIARGSALNFYKNFGFQETEWEHIYTEFARECETCP